MIQHSPSFAHDLVEASFCVARTEHPPNFRDTYLCQNALNYDNKFSNMTHVSSSVFLGGLPCHRHKAVQSQRPPSCFEPTDRQQPHFAYCSK